MGLRRWLLLFAITAVCMSLVSSCRRGEKVFTVALFEKITSLDPVTASDPKAANDRVRVLMFNSLVKKNEKFEYVPDLASAINVSADGLTYTFTIHENVKFHDGRPLSSADVKYTIDTLLAAPGAPKAASFFESSGGSRQSYVSSTEAPDQK